jgi:hypothetical protein
MERKAKDPTFPLHVYLTRMHKYYRNTTMTKDVEGALFATVAV